MSLSDEFSFATFFSKPSHMPDDQKPSTGKVKNLLQQIALELAFVDPVQENGVDGIHDLLTQLAGLFAGISGTAAPDFIQVAQRAAGRWIDERIAADSRLTAETIHFTNGNRGWSRLSLRGNITCLAPRCLMGGRMLHPLSRLK